MIFFFWDWGSGYVLKNFFLFLYSIEKELSLFWIEIGVIINWNYIWFKNKKKGKYVDFLIGYFCKVKVLLFFVKEF